MKNRISLGGILNPNSLHTVLQNAPFCIAKRTILECKTATFAMQNWQF